ncbi:MAG: GNAT family N-acetyltransferase [Candidatus Lokiarchaeota archaeon]|nr:GNAT family N-acetyltransferase [Candidatus Lokiarchaeota archaeon]MBD3199728.1 GNAT family N-acetyltransferase [Candidatus Lokiarchaeota archaeon]
MSKDQTREEDKPSKFSLKKKKIRDVFSNLGENFLTVEKKNPDYINMRLPADKITEDFENTLCNRIGSHGIELSLREAGEEDIETVIQLYKDSWHTTTMKIYDLTKDTLRDILKDPDVVGLIVSEDDVDCGFVLLDFEGPDNQIGKIAGLGIIPKYQGMGLGTYLAMSAWSYFKKRGIDEIRVEVHKENKIAYNFIKNFGFEEFVDRDYISPLK